MGPGKFFEWEWRSSWKVSGRPTTHQAGRFTRRLHPMGLRVGGRGGSAQYLVASSVTLGSFWGQPTARLTPSARKNHLEVAKNAETPFEQRVLPPQRGSVQGGGSHPLRRLLQLCSSPSCPGPAWPGPPFELHQGRGRLLQLHHLVIVLLHDLQHRLEEIEVEENGDFYATSARWCPPSRSGRGVIWFPLLFSLHKYFGNCSVLI